MGATDEQLERLHRIANHVLEFQELKRRKWKMARRQQPVIIGEMVTVANNRPISEPRRGNRGGVTGYRLLSRIIGDD